MSRARGARDRSAERAAPDAIRGLRLPLVARQTLRGCRPLPHVGAHPGLGFAVGFLAVAVIAALQTPPEARTSPVSTAALLIGALLIAATPVLFGAYRRAEFSDREVRESLVTDALVLWASGLPGVEKNRAARVVFELIASDHGTLELSLTFKQGLRKCHAPDPVPARLTALLTGQDGPVAARPLTQDLLPGIRTLPISAGAVAATDMPLMVPALSGHARLARTQMLEADKTPG